MHSNSSIIEQMLGNGKEVEVCFFNVISKGLKQEVEGFKQNIMKDYTGVVDGETFIIRVPGTEHVGSRIDFDDICYFTYRTRTHMLMVYDFDGLLMLRVKLA